MSRRREVALGIYQSSRDVYHYTVDNRPVCWETLGDILPYDGKGNRRLCPSCDTWAANLLRLHLSSKVSKDLFSKTA